MTVRHGNCIDIMAAMPDHSVDFILTEPPYITRYRPHKNNAGQTVLNDENAAWLKPDFAQMNRVLAPTACA